MRSARARSDHRGTRGQHRTANSCTNECVEAVAIGSTGEQGCIGLFAGEGVPDLNPAEVSIAEALELLEQHRRAGGLIHVDQSNQGFGLVTQDRRHDREHRRDARSSGEHRVAARLGRHQLVGEMPGGRHHVEPVTGLEFGVRPGGEHTARYLPDRHSQGSVGRCGAQRVTSTELDAVELSTQRQVLAVPKCEQLGTVERGGLERDDHALVGVAFHAADRELHEGRCLVGIVRAGDVIDHVVGRDAGDAVRRVVGHQSALNSSNGSRHDSHT